MNQAATGFKNPVADVDQVRDRRQDVEGHSYGCQPLRSLIRGSSQWEGPSLLGKSDASGTEKRKGKEVEGDSDRQPARPVRQGAP